MSPFSFGFDFVEAHMLGFILEMYWYPWLVLIVSGLIEFGSNATPSIDRSLSNWILEMNKLNTTSILLRLVYHGGSRETLVPNEHLLTT